MKIFEDVREIPQDWFYELEEKDEPKISTLELIDYDFYESQCELLGNMGLNLYIGQDGFYYMEMAIRQPIGDYGWRTVHRWHKCYEENISQIAELLDHPTEKGGVKE